MDKATLAIFIRKELTDQLKEDIAPRYVEIAINENLIGEIQISDILFSEIESAGFEMGGRDFSEIPIIIYIENSFEIIKFNNKSNYELIIRNCSGKSIIINSEGRYFRDCKEFIAVSIYGCSINIISIHEPIKRLNVIDHIYGKKLHVRCFDSKYNIESLYIRGNFEEVNFDRAITKVLTIILQENNPDIQSVTSVQIRSLEVEDLLISGYEKWRLNIFRTIVFNRFNIYSNKEISNLKFQNIQAKELNISLANSIIGPIHFEDISNIKQLSIRGYSESDQVVIQSICFINVSLEKDFIGNVSDATVPNGITFKNFTNRGELSFHSVLLQDNVLAIHSSLLGKTLFFNCTIPTTIKFDSSSIEDTLFFNTPMPTEVKVNSTEFNNVNQNSRDAFRQLKFSANKRADKELYNYYRYKELSSHYNVLSWVHNFLEKLTIFVNKSNNHGQSWGKTLILILFVIGPSLYSFFIISLGYRISDTQIGYDNLIAIWSHFFEFIIPGYLYPSKNKFLFLKDLVENNTGEISNLSFCSRVIIYINDIIVMPYLIIQMISAFRKHVS